MMEHAIPISETRSVCPVCLLTIPATLLGVGHDVIMRKQCLEHGPFSSVVWRGPPSYLSWTAGKRVEPQPHCLAPLQSDCPRACGLCPEHRQQTCTALIEVTERCNLGCRFCFADSGRSNSPDSEIEVIRRCLEDLLEQSGPVNLQLSGGEPTLRDDLPEIVALARSMGFPFVQLNTNGLRLASDPEFADALNEAGLSSVFLQFDGVDDVVYEKLRGRPLLGEKTRAIEVCGGRRIGVVLVPTLVPGVNTDQIGDLIDFAIERIPAVRGVHFQPVSYFGRIPKDPEDTDRITLPEIMRAIRIQTDGRILEEHLRPPGCENPACSLHGNFVVMPGGEVKPWAPVQDSGCCVRKREAAEGARKARRFVSQFWSFPEPQPCLTSGEISLGGWEPFLERICTHSFSISAMAFQDAWNLDLERLRDCCIHVVQPMGRRVPFCAFNLSSQDGRCLHRARANDHTP